MRRSGSRPGFRPIALDAEFRKATKAFGWSWLPKLLASSATGRLVFCCDVAEAAKAFGQLRWNPKSESRQRFRTELAAETLGEFSDGPVGFLLRRSGSRQGFRQIALDAEFRKAAKAFGWSWLPKLLASSATGLLVFFCDVAEAAKAFGKLRWRNFAEFL